MRRAVHIALALAASACGLIVGLGDHHLRDDGDRADAQATESGPDGADGGPSDDGEADAASDALDDGSLDASVDGPIELARGQQNPSHIVADTTQIYWVNEADPGRPGAIMAMAHDGGQPYALAPSRQNPVQVRLDGAYVYFTDDYAASDGPYGVFRVPRTGGAVEAVELGDAGLGYGPFGVGGAVCSEAHALDGGGAKIRCSSKNPPQGAPCFVYSTDSAGARFPSVVADQTYAYAIDTSASTIVRADLTDCTGASAIPFAAGQPGVRYLSFHGQFMDWVTATAVYHLDQGKPGQTPTVFSSGYTSLRTTSGYLSNGQLLTDEGAGMVFWARVGGIKELLGSGQGGPRGVCADNQGVVYWTNRASGQIMMAIP